LSQNGDAVSPEKANQTPFLNDDSSRINLRKTIRTERIGTPRCRNSNDVSAFDRMITLEKLTSLSQDEVQDIVRQRCSELGTVTDVVILKDDKWHGFALAGVEMSTPAETLEVLQRFGDHRLDAIVVIRIEQA
jgi:hypothetical protein